jgi:hypothetical protein
VVSPVVAALLASAYSAALLLGGYVWAWLRLRARTAAAVAAVARQVQAREHRGAVGRIVTAGADRPGPVQRRRAVAGGGGERR